jgi:hypothetical protein
LVVGGIMHYTSFEKVSEKMINQLLNDIEVYKSLHSYAGCLKENDSDYVPSTFVVNVRKEMSLIATKIDDNLRELREATKEVENMPFILFKEIKRLPCEIRFSTRCEGALIEEGIIYVGDLVVRTEAELLRIPHFGKKSLNEVKKTLSRWNLELNMHILRWRPINFKQLVEKYKDRKIKIDN